MQGLLEPSPRPRHVARRQGVDDVLPRRRHGQRGARHAGLGQDLLPRTVRLRRLAAVDRPRGQRAARREQEVRPPVGARHQVQAAAPYPGVENPQPGLTAVGGAEDALTGGGVEAARVVVAHHQVVDPVEAGAGGAGQTAPAGAAVFALEDAAAAQRQRGAAHRLAEVALAGAGVEDVGIVRVQRQSVDRQVGQLVAHRSPRTAAVGRLPDTARDAAGPHHRRPVRPDDEGPRPSPDVAGTERLPGVESSADDGARQRRAGALFGRPRLEAAAAGRIEAHLRHLQPGLAVEAPAIEGPVATEPLGPVVLPGAVGLIEPRRHRRRPPQDRRRRGRQPGQDHRDRQQGKQAQPAGEGELFHGHSSSLHDATGRRSLPGRPRAARPALQA